MNIETWNQIVLVSYHVFFSFVNTFLLISTYVEFKREQSSKKADWPAFWWDVFVHFLVYNGMAAVAFVATMLISILILFILR